MKRSLFGIFLLAVLFLVGLFSTGFMAQTHEPMARQLEQAGEAALAGEWEKALALSAGVRKTWQEGWHLSAAFADHGPMEEIDGLFAQLQVYGREWDYTGFAAVCAQLSRELEAMGDAHELSWWNLL